MDSTQKAIKRARDVLGQPMALAFISLIGKGIIVGFITGLIVGVFRRIIDETMKILTIIYPLMAHHPLYLLPYLLLTLVIGLILARILKPYLVDLPGSGIPQIEAVLLNEHQMNAGQILWRKFVGGLLAICPGLFLGREGPCIQMGACVGQLLGQRLTFNKEEKRILLECGIAAGLSAAFSAPLAGLIFLIEEITFDFQPQKCIPALAASITADLVTILFFGARPCLYLPVSAQLPKESLLWLVVLGILIGLLAFGYQYTILNLRWWYSKIKLPTVYHCLIPLFLVIPIGLWNANILGGSHNFITYVTNMGTSSYFMELLGLLIVFFIVRFVFSMISYGASVPGGIFMPILVLGALIGAIAGIIMIHQHLMPAACYLNLIVLSMAAYFGAIEEAPFTAIALLTEMVGSIDLILPMTILTFIAYITNDLLGGQPIYTALRREMFDEEQA